jgi:hypothetical protein
MGAARRISLRRRAWPVIRQAVTAQLRHAFGFDSSSAGLTGFGAAYPGIVAAVDSAPAPKRSPNGRRQRSLNIPEGVESHLFGTVHCCKRAGHCP